ncbi:MAG: hypothetical protein VKJ24_07365 [Synechococcales bacterium]|nr:hypothetical protein [Synechococcales bacterium]
MSAIYVLVCKVLAAGYLSLETENQLRKLLRKGCSGDDMDALLMLKQAVVFGHVKRQTPQSVIAEDVRQSAHDLQVA